MRPRLERRPEPSAWMRLGAPLIAALAMLFTGILVFSLMGKDPLVAFTVFFVKPIASTYGLGELLLKATPLMLCALGLAIGYRANVWNIGAEGQLTMGAIAGGGLALWLARGMPALAALLAIHLGVVMALFATLPYGKFAHGIFRTASLLRHAVEKRQPNPVGLGAD